MISNQRSFTAIAWCLFAAVMMLAERNVWAQGQTQATRLPAPQTTGPLPVPGQAVTPQAYPAVNNTVKIEDVTTVQGDRPNYIDGFGLVVGLAGTGGQSQQTIAMATSLFNSEGVAAEQFETSNLSAVLVSGKIPAFARKGEKIRVQVSVVDNATSLRNGTLVLTGLKGMDGEVYAVAQGPIAVGGSLFGDDTASVQKNHPNVGSVEAIVERDICMQKMPASGKIRLLLQNKSYANATEIQNAINRVFPRSSHAIDKGTVEVAIPYTFRDSLPQFISMIGTLRITPRMPATVVVNQKTGTIVVGQDVRISKIAFASENIVVSMTQNPIVSQPAPLSGGQTTVIPRTNVSVLETGGTFNVLRGGISVGELAQMLNQLGVSPSTLISVLGNLEASGDLQAKLIIK